MSKSKVISQEDFEAELQSLPQVFDSVAVGIIPRAGGGFSIVKVALDSKGMEAGDIEVIDTAESKWEANEKFKIMVIRQGVL